VQPCDLSVGHGEWVSAIMALAAKRGRVVVTKVHPWTETDVKMSMLDLLTMEKELVGSIFGSSTPKKTCRGYSVSTAALTLKHRSRRGGRNAYLLRQSPMKSKSRGKK
jgi:hypothetical protein